MMRLTLSESKSDKMVTPEELILSYKRWKTKGDTEKERTIITTDEYNDYIERASFRCPYNKDIRFCDGKDCPTRVEDFTEDYWGECVKARSSKLRLRQVAEGEILIHQTRINGWAFSLEQ